MSRENVRYDSDKIYPVILLPRQCTTFETNFVTSENVYIDLNITTPDVDGNQANLYSGFCNVKLIDTFNNFQRDSPESIRTISTDSDRDQMLGIFTEANHLPTYNQSRVWIDPSRSPYVYNQFDGSQEQMCESHSHITVEHHNTYITQNVYNYESSGHNVKENYVTNESEHKKSRKAQETTSPLLNYYDEDEFQCGVFLAQLPEEIMNEKFAKEQRIQNEENALKQLMSPEIQTEPKQRRTILFLGKDSTSGQTLQNISYTDPSITCYIEETSEERSDEENPRATAKKRYQCDKCKQIFSNISKFRMHMVGKYVDIPPVNQKVSYVCKKCGKIVKNLRKLKTHYMGHGNPERECETCHKVYASKFSLRIHRKIHDRKYQCGQCTKKYASDEELRTHLEKTHMIYKCGEADCSFVSAKSSDYEEHIQLHKAVFLLSDDYGDTFYSVDSADDFRIPADAEIKNVEIVPHDMFSDESSMSYKDNAEEERIKDADSVLAKVMSDQIFLLNPKKTKKYKFDKTCGVCCKSFDRISDLKRHLIEHVIRSTLAKTPVSKAGALKVVCEVCNKETFNKIDKYKAHLREHAKLTIYKCTFCDKTFSDSSNFSKHKKIHGLSYLQCDLCQRKFNSKKMIVQHMEYHIKNSPVKCKFCNKEFYFASMLNKHVKSTHSGETTSKHRCQFCDNTFKCLKDKWDHEWEVHNSRKVQADCFICGDKFRKYSELKRHCVVKHHVDIPPAKKLLKRGRKYKSSKYW